MSMGLVFAGSLAIAFICWYVCGLIPGRTMRGIARATLIAILCSPGVVVGHGFAVVPGLYALAMQPSIFSIGPMVVVWVIAMAIILGGPNLRNHRSTWPPAVKETILKVYPAKFLFLGLIAAVMMRSLIFAGFTGGVWIMLLKYGLFFGGGLFNLWLCYRAVRENKAPPLLVPLAFAAPTLVAASPTVPFVWYAAGAIGGLAGTGRWRNAGWVALGVFALLAGNSLLRTYYAATAESHITIQGGVAGNAAMAALYAIAGIVAWWYLKRRE